MPSHRSTLDLFANAAASYDEDCRAKAEARWLRLTRETLPAMARHRRDGEQPWPVSADHCFMRIILDAVHGRRWDDAIKARPAYRHMDTTRLEAAIALAEQVVAGEADLWALNAQSLRWRGKG
jgi:hypothetical protein